MRIKLRDFIHIHFSGKKSYSPQSQFLQEVGGQSKERKSAAIAMHKLETNKLRNDVTAIFKVSPI